jgi:FAD/FMN-containing dehydrogenase
VTAATYIAALTGAHVRVSGDALAELRARLQGPALTPSDAGYGDGRQFFNAMHHSRPALVVRCHSTADVVHAVDFARKAGTGSLAGRGSIVTSVLGGGHSVDGLAAVEGGLLIDLSPMRAVQVEPDRRLARVQGGALWRDVDIATEQYGLVAPGGMVSETGVGGLTLDGGHGWTRRAHGLVCDNLVEAEVVCADGEVRVASADSNPDLFWAIRGGGANFGVVTSFTFRLHPLGPVVAFAGILYPIEQLRQVLRAWRTYVTDAPDEVTSMCVALDMAEDPDLPESVRARPVAMVAGVHAGAAEEGMRALGPLRELGESLADISQPMRFTAVQTSFDRFYPHRRYQAYWSSRHLNELGDEAIDTISARALARPTPLTMVKVLHMGGAIARVRPEETACAARSAPFVVSMEGMWTDPEENADRIAWVRAAAREVGAPGDCLDLGRLAQVKEAYDPDNFFRLNRNVAPARRPGPGRPPHLTQS